MMTIRQVDRLWQLKAYERLIDELCTGRAEAVGGIRQLLQGAVPAAALTVIRMTELHQAHQPHVAKMVRFLLAAQTPAGGWGDAASTALAVRALAAGRGAGAAIERGIEALQELQKEDGEWPREAFRRFPGDPAVTAFVLLQLVESRSAAANALVDHTMDRLTDSALGDAQLAPLRRRVAARMPAAMVA